MSISDERVRDFIRAYKEEFGDELAVDQSREMLTRLVVLYQLLARPLPEDRRRRDDKDVGTSGTS